MGQDRKAAALRSTAVDALALARTVTLQWRRGSAARDLAGLFVLAVGTFLATAALALASVPPPGPIAVGITALLAAAWVVHSRRLPAAHALTSGWASGLPCSTLARRFAIALPFLAAATVIGAVFALLVLPFWSGSRAWAVLVGCVAGAVLVLARPQPGHRAAYPDSRYRFGTPSDRVQATLQPVVDDLHARVTARLQPAALARIVAPILVVLPAGMSIGDAATALGLIALLIYAQALWSQLRPFADGTAAWLASTPVDRARLSGLVVRSVRARLLICGLGLLAMLGLVQDSDLRVLGLIALLTLVLERVASRRLARDLDHG